VWWKELAFCFEVKRSEFHQRQRGTQRGLSEHGDNKVRVRFIRSPRWVADVETMAVIVEAYNYSWWLISHRIVFHYLSSS
jgi:hypothetical protein